MGRCDAQYGSVARCVAPAGTGTLLLPGEYGTTHAAQQGANLPGVPDKKEEEHMPRYLIERTFPEGLHIPLDEKGARICDAVVATNSDDLVTWVHSYVTQDRSKTYCIYDAPSPEAIRRAARRNQLPVDKILEVKVLDPYFYR
jgi:hypothetical protein